MIDKGCLGPEFDGDNTTAPFPVGVRLDIVADPEATAAWRIPVGPNINGRRSLRFNPIGDLVIIGPRAIFILAAGLAAVLGCATPARIGRVSSGPTSVENTKEIPAATSAAAVTLIPVEKSTPTLPSSGAGNLAPLASPANESAESPSTTESRNCVREVLGEARFSALREGARPSQEELELMKPCERSGRERGGRDSRARGNRSGAESLTSSVSTTPTNFKVAFIGDQGLGEPAVSVLELIRDEGAGMVLHQGDFDYEDDPDAWGQQISSILGPDYPYFASSGNHDSALWPASQAQLQARVDQIAGAACTGNLGVRSACSYNGLFFILSVGGQVDGRRERRFHKRPIGSR